MKKDFLQTKDIDARLGAPKGTAAKLLREGKLKGMQFGGPKGTWYIHESNYRNFVKTYFGCEPQEQSKETTLTSMPLPEGENFDYIPIPKPKAKVQISTRLNPDLVTKWDEWRVKSGKNRNAFFEEALEAHLKTKKETPVTKITTFSKAQF